jgi:hypothetical protein
MSARSIRWHLLYQIKFSGPAREFRSTHWLSATGKGLGIADFNPSLARVDGQGHLVLIAEKHSGRWYSSEVETKSYFGAAPGHSLLVQSRIDLPEGGKGFWPAFWAVGRPARTSWTAEPSAGEADIAETIDDDPWVAQLLHCGRTFSSGACKNGAPAVSHWDHLRVPSGHWGWHLYSWVWCNAGSNPYVAFYIDHRQMLRVTERELGTQVFRDAFSHPYYFIYDLAIGGWAGKPNAHSGAYAALKVDFIKFLYS